MPNRALEAYEFVGRTVDEAVAEGLGTLRLTSTQVEIQIVSYGSRGIFGLGSEPAHVRLVILPLSEPSKTESKITKSEKNIPSISSEHSKRNASILFFASNPYGTSVLALDEEIRAIQEK